MCNPTFFDLPCYTFENAHTMSLLLSRPLIRRTFITAPLIILIFLLFTPNKQIRSCVSHAGVTTELDHSTCELPQSLDCASRIFPLLPHFRHLPGKTAIFKINRIDPLLERNSGKGGIFKMDIMYPHLVIREKRTPKKYDFQNEEHLPSLRA